jgi:tetratricopeptide (TPR) repeat protein
VFVAFGFAGSRPKPQIAVAPAPVVAPPPPVAVTPPPAPAAPPEAPVAAKEPDEEAEEPADDTAADASDDKAKGDAPVGRGKGRAAAVAAAAAETKKALQNGERLLRAERFKEAREVFAKVAKSKRDRGPALVGLAEISFQEKKYGEAVRSAGKAAEYGGGAKARVLLGDAHFRMAHYREAAKAYEEALKLDPNNPSAKSGLALANKRM